MKRPVIDGLSGFFESAVHPERTDRFFSCLVNELRRRGVTVLMTLETRDAVSNVIYAPCGVSGFVDNLLFLRFVEHRGHVKRLLTVTNCATPTSTPVHLMEISGQGMRIAGLFASDGDVIPLPPSPSRPPGPAIPRGLSAVVPSSRRQPREDHTCRR